MLFAIVELGLWLFMARIAADAWINGGAGAGILATLITLAVGGVVLTIWRDLRRAQGR